MSLSFDDRDMGWSRIKRAIARLKNAETVVGILGQEGDDPATNLAARAAVHEYGDEAGNIPERSFMRSAYSEGEKALGKRMDIEYDGVIAGAQNPRRALGRIGEFHAGQIRKRITEGPFTPLSENYRIRPSGQPVTESSRPLIDTGQMRAAITHEEHLG